MSEGSWTLDKWMLENDLCRCCHAKGKFKNLAEPCSESGQEEVYAGMLKYCFDIDIVPVPGLICAMTYTICDSCIKSLCDAIKFKRSVATCEEKFKRIASCEEKYKDIFNRNVIEVDKDELNKIIEVKEEKPESCHDDDYFVDEDNDFHNAPDCDYVEEENKMDTDETVIKKPRKCQVKSKKVKGQTKKKIGRPRKMKEEPVPDEDTEKSKDQQPKFRLNDEDYTVDGATFACSRCDKRYDKIFSLRFHVKTKHYKIRRRFECPYCKEEFMTLAPLTAHKLEIHNIDDRFKCNACKGAFNTKVQLRKHINNFHMLGERYSCDLCEYESFSFEGMYKHKFKHKTSKDHHCKYCRKSFLRKTTKDLHERIHTGDRRKVCNICGQAFVQKASLNYHMTKYHPEVNF